MSWSADNRILFGQGTEGIGQVSADGGTPEVLVAVKDGEIAYQPSLLPDGETVLFTLAGSAGAAGAETQVVAQSLSTGDRRVLIEDGANARYVSTGHLVYMRDGELHGATFDIDRLVVTGPPVPLGELVAVGSAVSTAQFGLSLNGLLVYAGRDAIRTDRRFVWVNRSGQESEIDLPSGDYRFQALSPDSTRVAARVNDSLTGNADIHVFDLERGTQTRLTSSFATDAFPLWTRDGQAIVFWSSRAGSNLYRTRADGSGDPVRLTTPGSLTGLLRGIGWSGDGETLVFRGGGGEVLSVGPEGQTPELILQEPTAGDLSSLTADGRWLAYVSQQSGRSEVYVRPFPEVSENRWQISTDEGGRPLWRSDGAELFYRNAKGTLMSVPVSVGTSVSET